MSSADSDRSFHSFRADSVVETYALEWIIPDCSKMKNWQFLEFSTKAGAWKLRLSHDYIYLIRCFDGEEVISVFSDCRFNSAKERRNFTFLNIEDERIIFSFRESIWTSKRIETGEDIFIFNVLKCENDIFKFRCTLIISGHTKATEEIKKIRRL